MDRVLQRQLKHSQNHYIREMSGLFFYVTWLVTLSSDFTVAAISLFVERNGLFVVWNIYDGWRFIVRGKANVMHFLNNYRTRIPKKTQYELKIFRIFIKVVAKEM